MVCIISSCLLLIQIVLAIITPPLCIVLAVTTHPPLFTLQMLTNMIVLAASIYALHLIDPNETNMRHLKNTIMVYITIFTIMVLYELWQLIFLPTILCAEISNTLEHIRLIKTPEEFDELRKNIVGFVIRNKEDLKKDALRELNNLRMTSTVGMSRNQITEHYTQIMMATMEALTGEQMGMLINLLPGLVHNEQNALKLSWQLIQLDSLNIDKRAPCIVKILGNTKWIMLDGNPMTADSLRELSVDNIDRKYRTLSLKYHPDKLVGKSEQQRQQKTNTFLKINSEKEFLLDMIQRPTRHEPSVPILPSLILI